MGRCGGRSRRGRGFAETSSSRACRERLFVGRVTWTPAAAADVEFRQSRGLAQLFGQRRKAAALGGTRCDSWLSEQNEAPQRCEVAQGLGEARPSSSLHRPLFSFSLFVTLVELFPPPQRIKPRSRSWRGAAAASAKRRAPKTTGTSSPAPSSWRRRRGTRPRPDRRRRS